MMDDKEDFYSFCFHAAGMFLAEKGSCMWPRVRSVTYFQPGDMEGYQVDRIPADCVLKVTVEFAPESETEL